MKAIAGVLIVLLSALPAGAQHPGTEKGTAKAPDYFPLKAGEKWHYEADPGNGQKIQIMTQVAKIETIDGKPMARLESVMSGTVVGSEHLTSTDEGIFRTRYNDMEVTPPVCILKYPVKEGTTWETKTRFGAQEMTVNAREGKKADVDVPAGTYPAVTVAIQTTMANGNKIVANYWFASDVGIVKQSIDIGGRAFTMQLAKFEPGK
jgi:hypothetical protein